jgi:Spy/CpxP family protein refolding chaperone
VFVRSALLALTVALASPLAAAAQAAPPVSAAHHHIRYLAALRSVGLTPAQKQQIAGFLQERKAANAGADAPTRHANGRRLRREIIGVLTPEQRTQLRAAIVQQRTESTAR